MCIVLVLPVFFFVFFFPGMLTGQTDLINNSHSSYNAYIFCLVFFICRFATNRSVFQRLSQVECLNTLDWNWLTRLISTVDQHQNMFDSHRGMSNLKIILGDFITELLLMAQFLEHANYFISFLNTNQSTPTWQSTKQTWTENCKTKVMDTFLFRQQHFFPLFYEA